MFNYDVHIFIFLLLCVHFGCFFSFRCRSIRPIINAKHIVCAYLRVRLRQRHRLSGARLVDRCAAHDGQNEINAERREKQKSHFHRTIMLISFWHDRQTVVDTVARYRELAQRRRESARRTISYSIFHTLLRCDCRFGAFTSCQIFEFTRISRRWTNGTLL